MKYYTEKRYSTFVLVNKSHKIRIKKYEYQSHHP